MWNIEWHKVTWYSKISALFIFVFLLYTSFHLGKRYGHLFTCVVSPEEFSAISQTSQTQNNRYTNSNLKFSVEYPPTWRVEENVNQYTLAAFGPVGGKYPVRVYLEKNNYQDIYALKAAVDKRLPAKANSLIRHYSGYDTLLYAKIQGMDDGVVLLYTILDNTFILGIVGENNEDTWKILNSYKKI